MSEQNYHGSQQVFDVLAKVGQRAQIAHLLPLLVFGLAAGVTLFGVAVVWLGQDWLQVAWPVAGVVALAIAVASSLVLTHRSRPGVVARRVDFDLGLREQLSTAAEVSLEGRDNSIVRSLVGRASETAARIDVVRAVPLGSRMLGISLGVLVLALAGSAIAYGLYARPVGVVTTTDVAAEASAQPAIAAEDLDVLAELVAADAERQDSDYLEALANSIEALAQAARDGASQEELQAQLQQLMEHANAGYAGENPEWLQDAAGNAGSALQNAVAFNAAQQKAAEQRARLAEMRGDGPRISSADMYTLSDDRLARSAAPQPPGNSAPDANAMAEREGELHNSSQGGGETAARPVEDEAFTSAGSLPVGAAAQSGKGESNIAGGGSQALAADSQFLETMADPTQVLSIAAENVTEGNRIRMHVPTTAEVTEAGALAGGGGDAWERQAAQLVTRQSIEPHAGAVVSHYFNRPVAEPGS